ncbi:MAG TPA: isopeptide-forming domain-containing fimbrial protein [Gammaproteobacteria bacterium]
MVADALPAGMALESFTLTKSSNIGYATPLIAQPAPGATGTLTWSFGDIANPPSNNGTPIDTLVIRYVAKVITDAPAAGVDYDTTNLLDNQATLTYTGGDPALNPALTATERLEVRQPQMQPITKVDTGSGRVGSGTSGDPYQVNITSDVMSFHLSSCNTGLAPAYGVKITDLLAPELDESDLANPPLVKIGTTTLNAGTGFTYTAPPRGGTMTIALTDSAPVNPGQCVTVDYSVGFHTDLTTQNVPWSNEAQVAEYRSLPLAQSGRVYPATAPAQVWMVNLAGEGALLKTLVSPTNGEARIGDQVVYSIRVPAVAMNVALDNVVVTDTLHGALEYVSATATLNGTAHTINLVQSGQTLNFGLGTIPAGQQAVITLTTRVANNDQANAGTSFTNTADYTYTGKPASPVTSSTSAPVKIIEPLVSVTKVASATTPLPGDLITYTLTFTATGGAAGDDRSNAYDLSVEDSLGLGLLYEAGSATLNGAALADPATSGDGTTTAQKLTWSLTNGHNIDLPEGTSATVTYQVRVLNSVAPGSNLTNSVIGRWTSLDGVSAVERNGSNTPVVNDYFTAPATVTMTTPLTVTMVKSVVNATTGANPGANAIPGNTLRYTLVLTNDSVVPVAGATVKDDLAAQFAPGTLHVINISAAGATDTSNPTGGVNGTGVVQIGNLSLAAKGDPNDTVTIVFEATLAAVIDSGTVVLNQAQLSAGSISPSTSNQTSTLISSAPVLQIYKTSQDMTGDANVLVAGDRLHYTITVKNIGNENATGVMLRDMLPAYTTYVANTTTLNGVKVADPSAGVSALQSGMLVNAPGGTPGTMLADASTAAANVATVTFDVVLNADVLEGIFISNQGFVTGSGSGSGPFTDTPSDDPDTAAINDPTLDFVGNLPRLDATKVVALQTDNNANGAVDVGDVVRYTITVNNLGTKEATGVVLSDAMPANTTYLSNTTRLNGQLVADNAGSSALVSGVPINATGSANGTIPNGANAVVTFDVQVAATAVAGDVISNQGYVASNELATEPTDADGNDFNGDQPTTFVVGSAQQLSIIKQVTDLNGGVVEAGDTLEYAVIVTNDGKIAATQVVISDDLSSLATWANYVVDSATLTANGTVTSASLAGGIVTANVGNLAVGATATLRFRVQLKDQNSVPIGTHITNTGLVGWNSPQVTATASVSVDVGGVPGTATLSGRAWHDANFDNLHDNTELDLAGWRVEVWRNNVRLGSVTAQADGSYSISGLAATVGSDLYEIRFQAPGAGANTASLGEANSTYSTTQFIDGPQRISGIIATSGGIVPNLNLPIDPNGVVFNSITRAPVPGATLTLLHNGATVASNCFADPAQQGQVTLASGYYKFDLNFSDPSCPAGADYVIQVTPPARGYFAGPSHLIPPVSNDPAFDATATPFAVPACSPDAITATADYCEAMGSEFAPPLAVPANAVVHHLYLTLSTPVPGDSQLFNNHIAIDPHLDNALTITKTSALVNVNRGALVPYTITVNNTLPVTLTDLSIVDTFPPGFKYVAGSARVNGKPLEPVKTNRTVSWNNLTLATNQQYTIKLLLIVGSGVAEGEYVNRAQVIQTVLNGAASGVAMATVRVVPDPTFDCSDIIGKVFDDANVNGYQDKGEKGLPGVRVVTARGLIVTTDDKGRFHVSCAIAPDERRGSNFIMKVDDRSLPTGYRITTENPRVQRATRGKMLKFNFGATIHKVVRLDIANGVFMPNSTEMRIQWKPRTELLMGELKKGRSILRLAYMAEVEEESLVEARLETMKQEIMRQWSQQNGGYELTIETEVFWRTGAPPSRSALK